MDRASADPVPRAAAWLGYGGLVPFVVLAVATFADRQRAPFWSDALFAYGAVILSFVGALHWGFAMTLAGLSSGQRDARFAWSVVPPLLAWPALLLPALPASLLLVAGFSAHYWQDRRLAGMAELPAWYLPLRLRLSSVACLCLAAGGLAGRA